MMLTKGVELSGYFDVLGRKMVRRFATERRLALFMVFSAAVLSTFLTNDVALFIIVPLTLTLRRLCEIPVSRLIIFEALAVNAGSLFRIKNCSTIAEPRARSGSRVWSGAASGCTSSFSSRWN